MIQNYFQGKIEETEDEERGDKELRLAFEELKKIVFALYGEYALNKALEEIWVYINSVNKYLADHEPWRLAKEETKRRRLGRILHQTASAIRGISYLIYPVMPETSEKIWEFLGEETLLKDISFPEFKFENYRLGQMTKKAESLFPRILLKDFLREEAPQPLGERKDEMEEISFDEFKKMDLRVGEIVQAERVPGTDKLIKLEVDIGTEKRTMVAGVADVYSPEDLRGKKLVVIVNLKPAVIRGIESQGMLLAAEVEGKAIIPFFEGDVPAGAKVH